MAAIKLAWETGSGSQRAGSSDAAGDALPHAARAATHMEYLIQNTSPCLLRPFCFFVSWQGVLTLAFKGYPAPLVTLKADLSDYYGGLPQEMPGSLWPKTSLAALKEGTRLTPEQLKALIAICWECSGAFQTPGAPRSQAVLVDRLSSVVYECRSLERQISKQVIMMTGGGGGGGGGGNGAGGQADGDGDGGGARGAGGGSGGGGRWGPAVDTSEPSEDEQARVEAVIKAAEDPSYWFAASRDGNREGHYRGNALGATLVHELSCFLPGTPADGGDGSSGASGDVRSGGSISGGGGGEKAYSSALPGIVRRFRARVDAVFPGMYAWWDEASLHVTIRALIP